MEKLDDTPLPDALAPAAQEQEPEHTASELVRVSIVLEEPATLDAGFSTQDIADNARAMQYRSGLKERQADCIARVEEALGETLDVRWNLTLTANLISANVRYGQLEAIAAVPACGRWCWRPGMIPA